MLHLLLSAFTLRLAVVLFLVHLGLALGIHVTGRISAEDGWDSTTLLLVASIALLYGGFLLTSLFLILGLSPWVRKLRQVDHWSVFLEQLPRIITAAREAQSAWQAPTTRASVPLRPRVAGAAQTRIRNPLNKEPQ